MKTSPRRAPMVFAMLCACNLAAGSAAAQVAGDSRPYGEPRYSNYPPPALPDDHRRIGDFSPRGNLGRTANHPPAPIWAGLYVGGHAGFGWGSVYAGHPGLGTSRTDGGIAGMHLGYNWQTGGLVAGLEGDLTAGWVDGHRVFASGYDLVGKNDWTSSLRVRLGYSFSNVLVYATGGLAVGKLGISASDAGTSFSDSRWQTGYVVGGGIEAKLSPMMSARAEVLRYGFGDKDFSFGGTMIPVRGDETVVRGGLSIHFN